MKNINIIFVLSFLFIAQASFAQNHFKIGPSALINANLFSQSISTPIGGEISYELGLSDHFSVNLAGNIHYGEEESIFLENRTNKIKQKDLLIGTQVDVRYHFKGIYNGSYIGIGGDVKHITAKNYFTSQRDGDPNAIYADYDFNIGASYGIYIPLKYGYLNPNIYIGGNPDSEYELHAKLGMNYVF